MHSLETKEKVAFSDDLCLVVGAAGFEPTTTCPPDKCATKLRYAPIENSYTPFCPKKQAFYRYLVFFLLGTQLERLCVYKKATAFSHFKTSSSGSGNMLIAEAKFWSV